MPEWLQDSFPNDPNVSAGLLGIRLSTALVAGCLVAGIYHLTRRRAGSTPSLVPTLVLLTVLIGMITLVIGNSVARAFSLVGALAIVRFRTVVEDARDTAFVIFAVAVGMALGSGFFTVVVVGVPIAAVAALLFRQRPPPADPEADEEEHELTVRVGIGFDPEGVLNGPLGKYLDQRRLVATATARQGSALEVRYAVRLRPEVSAAHLVAELNGIEGIQGVELRQG